MTIVISLGGSIVAPQEGPSGLFLLQFRNVLLSWLEAENRKAIIVVGGGSAARQWQKAYKEFIEQAAERETSNDGNRGVEPAKALYLDESLDRIGIAATRLNAQLVKEVFSDYCPDSVVTDPSADISMRGKILVAAGWKPGFSTDYDAVLLAERFYANQILNLSNISQIYSADPKKDPGAKPLAHITFDALLEMTGRVWNPGANLPFDPIAAAKAKELGLRVIFASGSNLENFDKILSEKSFIGTIID
ncbi:MAG: UMP kinase [Rectinema sp.]